MRLLLYGQSKPKDVDGWDKIQWGMTMAEARSAYSIDAEPENKDEWTLLELKPVQLAGVEMGVQVGARRERGKDQPGAIVVVFRASQLAAIGRAARLRHAQDDADRKIRRARQGRKETGRGEHALLQNCSLDISIHIDPAVAGAIVSVAESWHHLFGIHGNRQVTIRARVRARPYNTGMAPLRGSFWVFVLYDVAEEIRIDKLRDLVGAETARPQPSFKHPAPEYVRFERPPAIEYPEPVAIETGEKFEARIKYFDYGVASVELKMEFEADWEQLIRLSNRWILAPEIERRTAELIQSRHGAGGCGAWCSLIRRGSAKTITSSICARRWMRTASG